MRVAHWVGVSPNIPRTDPPTAKCRLRTGRAAKTWLSWLVTSSWLEARLTFGKLVGNIVQI